VVDGKKEDGNLKWSEEQLQKAIEIELKNEKSAKDISTQLAQSSGWSKREIYSFINKM
jgi:hypothetical protein